MSSTTPGASAPPLVTRRSVALACLGVIVALLVLGTGHAIQNGIGVLYALAVGVLVVSLVLAYGGAMVLAFRARSLLLALVIWVIPVPPFGPLLCVLLSGLRSAPPADPPGRPR